MISSRRSFLTGLGAALVAGPAIVRASSIMPVKRMFDPWADLNIVETLSARLDSFDGQDDPRLYVRYSGYEGVEFDATTRQWKSPDQIAEEVRIAVRAQLFDLKNGRIRHAEPDYDRMKERWARSFNG
jgi:hypothetical protein